MLNHRNWRQKHVPHAQLLREGLGKHHPLGRLHRQGRQPLGEAAVIRSSKLAQPRSIEQLLQVLATGLITGRIERPGRRRHLQLRGHDPQQWWMWSLALSQDTAGIAKVSHLHGDAEAVVAASMMADEGQIRTRERS